jgi:restriction endonuclease S subunit
MMSDRFMKRAVDISVGSLSPTINWTTLKLEDFSLPPLDQQRRIAEVLWAMDEALQRSIETLRASKDKRQAIVSDFVTCHKSDRAQIGDLVDEVQYGTSSKAIWQEQPGLWPLLRIPNVIGGKIDLTDLVWLVPAKEFEKYRLSTGDVLIVRTNGNPDYVGRTAVFEGTKFDECLFASYLIRLRSRNDKLSPRYLHEMLQSEYVMKEIRKQVKSSAGNYNLNAQGIRGLRIPFPERKDQEQLLKHLSLVDAAVSATSLDAHAVRSVLSAAVNDLLTPLP